MFFVVAAACALHNVQLNQNYFIQTVVLSGSCVVEVAVPLVTTGCSSSESSFPAAYVQEYAMECKLKPMKVTVTDISK